MKQTGSERVTFTIRSREDLDEIMPYGVRYPRGEKAQERLEQRLTLGLPVRVSISKTSILDRLKRKTQRIRVMRTENSGNPGGH